MQSSPFKLNGFACDISHALPYTPETNSGLESAHKYPMRWESLIRNLSLVAVHKQHNDEANWVIPVILLPMEVEAILAL